MNLDPAAIISYYSRFVMAKNQGHFEIARALLDLLLSADSFEAGTAEQKKALEKISQAKGYASAVTSGQENQNTPPESEAKDWESYVFDNPPYTKKLALALALYFERAGLLNQAYEMYLAASELEDEVDADVSVLAKIEEALDGTMANRIGKSCEDEQKYAEAAGWYKKAKDAGNAEASVALDRMQAFYGLTRYYTPWMEVAKKTGRKEIYDAVVSMIKADAKMGGSSIDELDFVSAAVPPCTEEIEYWERELDNFAKFSEDSLVCNGYVAVGNLLERFKMYNLALRLYKKAVPNHPTANQAAHRMLPLKSKSVPLRDAEDIYDESSPVPAIWKRA